RRTRSSTPSAAVARFSRTIPKNDGSCRPPFCTDHFPPVPVILSAAKDLSAAEPQPTLPYVILSRRSAAKNLWLRSLRSFAVCAAQDDVGSSLHAKILGCSSSGFVN